MKRESKEAIIRMAAELWLDCDDHDQALFFNILGKEYRELKAKVGWSVERQLCAAMDSMDEDGKQFCEEIAAFVEIKKND